LIRAFCVNNKVAGDFAGLYVEATGLVPHKIVEILDFPQTGGQIRYFELKSSDVALIRR